MAVNENVRRYIHSLNSLNKGNSRYTTKDIYDMIKTKLSFNYLPSDAKYSTINKKVVSNSYHDFQIMNQLSYDLCTRNIDIYINWLESFHIIENLENILEKKHSKNISDINQLEQILLSGKCTTSNTQLSSIASENGINNDQNVHRSIILLTNLLKASVSGSSKKGKSNNNKDEATGTADEPTKEYCIITTEFCKNIKQAWLMLPKNDINLKDYSSNMKRIVNINKYKTPRKINSDGNSIIVKKTLKQLVDNLFNIS